MTNVIKWNPSSDKDFLIAFVFRSRGDVQFFNQINEFDVAEQQMNMVRNRHVLFVQNDFQWKKQKFQFDKFLWVRRKNENVKFALQFFRVPNNLRLLRTSLCMFCRVLF